MGDNSKKGRPTKFNQAVAYRMLVLYTQGKTDLQVAQELGISAATLFYWKARYEPDFLSALKDAKGVADDLVEGSLFARATGYTIPEEKVFCSEGSIVTHDTLRHYPPDVTACIFWLKNRRASKWRERAPEFTPPKTIAGKISFEDFCLNAGYPAPYERQHEMRAWLFKDEIREPRLLLGSRGYGKTDYGTLMGSAYEIYSRPESTSILLVTKSPERNASILREVASALEKNGVSLEIENAKELKVPTLIGKDNSLSAETIGASSFRGRHPKLVIMDDPVTPEDASEATRKRVKVVYDELYKLCRNIVIIGQPVHKFDLYQELRPILRKLELPYGSIPELDPDLDAMRKANITEDTIQASYFLNVTADKTNPFDDMRYVDEFPKQDSIAFIDPSFKGVDYTALSVARGYGDGVVVQGHAWKRAWYHCTEDMAKRLKELNVRKLCIETNCLGQQPIVQMRDAMSQLGVGNIEIVGKESVLTSKHSRIMAAGNFAHLIHLSKRSDKIYSDQVRQYEYGAEHDDAPDSLASLLAWIGLIKGKETGR